MIKVRNIVESEVEKSGEEKKIIKNEEDGEKPVMPETIDVSEDVHGGQESTQSIEDSPNPGEKEQSENEENGEDNEQQKEDNGGKESVDNINEDETGELTGNSSQEERVEETGGDKDDYEEGDNEDDESSYDYDKDEENDDSEENEEDEQEYSGMVNQYQAFRIEGHTKNLRLRTALWRFIEFIANDKIGYSHDLQEKVVMKFALRRLVNHYPLKYAYGNIMKERVAIVLDNSGSMQWVSFIVNDIFNVLKDSNTVKFFVAPNGYIEQIFDKQRWVNVDHQDAMDQLKNFTVIYFGDYDGADTPIELSWYTRVYWFCPESRYRYFSSHDWVHYTEKDYKGIFARVYSEDEIIRAINDILQHIYQERMFLDYHEDETFYDDND